MILALVLATLAQDNGDDVHYRDFEDLAERWEVAARELGVPGMAVTVVLDGEVVHRQTYGVRDTERGLPVTEDTMFYIASATKPFVATAVQILAGEGEVELDAPVKRYLPRFELADARATQRITVRDLLSHRPGINSFPIVFLDAYTGEITEDRYYHFLAEVQPTGTVTYTNVHFTLAGRIVEAVSGAPWRDFLDERIFTPAGMDRTTGYATWMYAQDDVAIPTLSSDDGFLPAPVRKTDETMHAAGGLGTSIHDLGQWLKLQLSGGKVDGERVVPSAKLAEMFEQQSTFAVPDGVVPRMEGFGLGWNRGTYRGRPYLQHGGGYIGSASLIAFMPEDAVGVAVLANTDSAGNILTRVVSTDVLDRVLGHEPDLDLLPGFIEQAQRARSRGTERPDGDPVTLTMAPEAYSGTFTDENWGTVRVTVEDGRLSFALGQIRAELVARGEDRFVAWSPRALEVDGAFVIEDGEVVAVTLSMEDGSEVRFTRSE